MKLDIICYRHLLNGNRDSANLLETALLQKGIVGIEDVPNFVVLCQAYIQAAREFSALEQAIKQQYAPLRDTGDTEGYEYGAEWFKDPNGLWQVDDKKASYYAYIPNHAKNKWPREINLKTSYLALGELIFNTGKLVLNKISLDNSFAPLNNSLVGYGRMLHYHKEKDLTNANPNWCGAHFDHGVLTGLIPAYYFRDGVEVDEPDEAGLYITPSNSIKPEKIETTDKNILLFQVGEFGQLISNDRIKATQHLVKKTYGSIERFTFALFYSLVDDFVIKSNSTLIKDTRYTKNQLSDGSISYGAWQKASYERYRAK